MQSEPLYLRFSGWCLLVKIKQNMLSQSYTRRKWVSVLERLLIFWIQRFSQISTAMGSTENTLKNHIFCKVISDEKNKNNKAHA